MYENQIITKLYSIAVTGRTCASLLREFNTIRKAGDLNVPLNVSTIEKTKTLSALLIDQLVGRGRILSLFMV